MARTVAIGVQDFEKLIQNNCFYIDKTEFIKEWWESKDEVTLITRPRRFGKTLNMNMLERFFSNKYQGQGALFENLNIWKDEKYRNLQGSYPVLFLSFAGVKATEFDSVLHQMCGILKRLYVSFYDLINTDVLTDGEKVAYKKMADEMPAQDAPTALYQLSDYLFSTPYIRTTARCWQRLASAWFGSRRPSSCATSTSTGAAVRSMWGPRTVRSRRATR